METKIVESAALPFVALADAGDPEDVRALVCLYEALVEADALVKIYAWGGGVGKDRIKVAWRNGEEAGGS